MFGKKNNNKYNYVNANNVGLKVSAPITSTETGFDEVVDVSAFITIFPNPVSNYVSINSQSKISSIKILNSLGGIAQEVVLNDGHHVQLNLSSLKSGVYYISGITENGCTFTKQLVKK